jgi:hypothetical protein
LLHTATSLQCPGAVTRKSYLIIPPPRVNCYSLVSLDNPSVPLRYFSYLSHHAAQNRQRALQCMADEQPTTYPFSPLLLSPCPPYIRGLAAGPVYYPPSLCGCFASAALNDVLTPPILGEATPTNCWEEDIPEVQEPRSLLAQVGKVLFVWSF